MTLSARAQAQPRDGFSRTSPSGSYLAARHASGQRDVAAAASYYRPALRGDRGNNELLGRTFLAVLANGEVDEGVKLAERVLQVDKNDRIARLRHSATRTSGSGNGQSCKIGGYHLCAVLEHDWRASACSVDSSPRYFRAFASVGSRSRPAMGTNSTPAAPMGGGPAPRLNVPRWKKSSNDVLSRVVAPAATGRCVALVRRVL
jgi:hypothetical protein